MMHSCTCRRRITCRSRLCVARIQLIFSSSVLIYWSIMALKYTTQLLHRTRRLYCTVLRVQLPKLHTGVILQHLQQSGRSQLPNAQHRLPKMMTRRQSKGPLVLVINGIGHNKEGAILFAKKLRRPGRMCSVRSCR